MCVPGCVTSWVWVSWLCKGRQSFPTSKHILELSVHLVALLTGWLWKAPYITAVMSHRSVTPSLSHTPQTRSTHIHTNQTHTHTQQIVERKQISCTWATVWAHALSKQNDSLLISKTQNNSDYGSFAWLLPVSRAIFAFRGLKCPDLPLYALAFGGKSLRDFYVVTNIYIYIYIYIYICVYIYFYKKN